ncbi:MAG TPA: enoyl-ACP reductase FabI [Acidimicrobiales bacterium]|nr:enoyl-ACP reductase FabI [Acidimicrobiales bacterium]
MLLEGKKIVVTGVSTESSIAFAVARVAQEQGAEVLLTSWGRIMSLTERVAKRLPTTPDVLELDVTSSEHVRTVAEEIKSRWGHVDGVVHAIANANPETCLGGDVFRAPWDDVAAAMQISAFSLKVLAEGFLPLFKEAGAGSVVGLDFDATKAFPMYNWMGVTKAALESLNRYLARDLGPSNVRCNLVAAGPLKTLSAKSIPGFEMFEDVWVERAPLGWDLKDTEPAAKAVVALLSDWFPATTGEIIHVDGGFHAVGA